MPMPGTKVIFKKKVKEVPFYFTEKERCACVLCVCAVRCGALLSIYFEMMVNCRNGPSLFGKA